MGICHENTVSNIYLTRRKQLALRLPKKSIAIIPAASEQLRNGDAHYTFRQDSSFYYLTGFDEPDACLLITSEQDSILFLRPRNIAEEQWTGERLGPERAIERLQVTKAFDISDWDAQLLHYLMACDTVYYPRGVHEKLEDSLLSAWKKVKKQVRRGVSVANYFADVSTLIGEMRLFKDAQELELMRQAAKISIAGHKRLAKACRQAPNEAILEAEFLYEIHRLGCREVAYTPIIAAGNNACILHYTANNAPIKANDLILVDAGGEFSGYAADITRVYPASGCFTGEQRAIYDCVYAAQQAAMALIKPGCPWVDMQEMIVKIITQGLVDLNILQGSVDGLIEQGAYKAFYMHQSGHWLGLDVHDTGEYRINNAWRPLEPNMCLTVEPGIYIASHLSVDKRWQGIGVRIEDDVVVTSSGYELLSQGLSAKAEDIEAFMRD